MMTFYFGFHNGSNGRPPDIQHEFTEDVSIDPKKAFKLLRAMREILRYFLTGAADG
jgi:hypothetical protein